MKITVFEGYTVGKIERGIPFPAKQKKLLSTEQKRVLQMKGGESFVLVAHAGESSADNAERLVQWARLKGIRIVRRRLDADSVRICYMGIL
jgi:hypothetical protein